MSDDIRDELARIVRATRAAIVREDAQGRGDMLLRDSLAERRTGAAPTPSAAAPSASLRSEPRRAIPTTAIPMTAAPRSERAPGVSPVVPSESAAAAAPRTGVDLFGKPVVLPEPEPRAAAPTAAAAAGTAAPAEPVDLPPAIEYHPRGWAEREGIATASLPVLQQVADEIRACRKCGLCDTRRNTVPGVGSARGGIVFVGEAPGADEDAQGEPFVGRAGQLLTKIIQAMQDQQLIPHLPLARDSVYICNVLKCRPPENRNPLPNEIEQCSPYLKRQLEALQPRIICCLGKFAAELLLGVKGTIASLRGRVYHYRGAKLIVTYHPAACLRNPGYKRPVWEDMQLLAREYLTD